MRRPFLNEIVTDAGLRLALVPRCDNKEAASLTAFLQVLRLGPRGEVDTDDAAGLAPLPPPQPPRSSLIGAINILYTSGSTGRPKGVIGRESGFFYRIRWMHQAFPFVEGHEEVVLRRTPLTFVDSMWEIWGALLGGVPLFLHTAALGKKQDPAFLACPGATRATLTPSLLAALLQCNAPILRAGSSLRTCLCSGEALSWDLAKQFLARSPSCTLLHLYGSTEVSGDASWAALTTKATEIGDEKELQPTPGLVPLGRAIPGTYLWIVEDRTGEKIQIGEGSVGAVDIDGELWVAGPGVALGYYGYPPESDLDSKFGRLSVRNSSLLLFKTGDWVRYVSEGSNQKDGSEKGQRHTLLYRGRRGDSFVKVRGVRMGLEEAEQRTASALGLEVSGGNLGMMVVQGRSISAREDAVLLLALTWEVATRWTDAAELRKCLRTAGLPAEMIPSQIIVGVKGQPLPLTSSGKMDRQQLACWGSEFLVRGTPMGQLAKEEDDIEKWLEDCFAKLVGRQHSEGQRGLSLFDRGGHSLMMMQALSEIETRFGKASAGLMVHDLARTVPEIARLLSQTQHPGNVKKRMRSHEENNSDISQGLRLMNRWRFAFEKCVDAPPCLVLIGPMEVWWVLVGAHDHFFVALDLKTGKEQWRTRVEGRIEGEAAVQGPLVFVPSHDSRLYAFSIRTGKLAWSYRTEGEIKSAPLPFCLAGPADTKDIKLVGFGSYDGHLYIVKASSGELWAPPSSLGGSPFASPLLLPAAAAGAARLVTVTNRGRVAQWLVQGQGTVTLDWCQEVGCAVFTTPIFSRASSLLVLGGTDGSALALDPAQGGRLVWRVMLNGSDGVSAAPVFASPCLLPANDEDDEGVLVACESSLHCLVITSGKRKWLIDTSAREGEVITGKPVVLNGSRFVLVGTSQGRIIVWSAQKKRPEHVATLNMGLGRRLSSPTVVLASKRLVDDKNSWITVVGSRDEGVYMVEIEEM
ncbi:amino acid adenylation domain protein [Nannochloropsis oceanica]